MTEINSPSPANRSGGGTLHGLQLLRAMAALLVVLFHAQQAFARRYAPPAFEGESYLFAFGAVGVHIFFVISGFIMIYTSRFDDGFDASAFFGRRLKRIYPIYWICAVLYLAMHWIIGQPYALNASEVAGALMLLPGQAAGIIGPAWTLAFEMYFYLCFGLAMIAGMTRGAILLAAVFLAMIAAGLVIRIDSPLWKLATNGLLLEFLAGMGIGWLLRNERLPRRGGIAVTALALAVFAGGIALGYDRLPSMIVWGVPSVLLILGAVMIEAGREAPLPIRALGHFGDSSYALYLIHVLVVTLAVAFATESPWLATLEPALASVPIAIASIGLAELLHHRLERRLLRRLNPKRSLVPARRAGAD